MSVYGKIQNKGSDLIQRNILDFEGLGVAAADDPVGLRTQVTIPNIYATIQKAGIGFTQRPNLNFLGTNISLSDDAVNGVTKVNTLLTNTWQFVVEAIGDPVTGILDTGVFAAFNYLLLLISWGAVGSGFGFQFNGDAGAHYNRRDVNDGAESSNFGESAMILYTPTSSNRAIASCYIVNIAAQAKRVLARLANFKAGVAPDYQFGIYDWTNTSAQITRVAGSAANLFDSTAYITVFGKN